MCVKVSLNIYLCICVCVRVRVDTKMSNRLWSVEKSVSNLTESLSAAQQLTQGNTPVFVPSVGRLPGSSPEL